MNFNEIMHTDGGEPERGEVTITYQVDDAEPVSFTSDTTTSGCAAFAVRKILNQMVQDDISGHLDEMGRNTQSETGPSSSLRRVVVTGRVVLNGTDVKPIQLDSTTNGNVYSAAWALVAAAKGELWTWLEKRTSILN